MKVIFGGKKERDWKRESAYWCCLTTVRDILSRKQKFMDGEIDIEDLLDDLDTLEYLHGDFIREECEKLLS